MEQANQTPAVGTVGGAAERKGLEPTFVYTVVVLLLVIIAALTGLTLRMNRRARLAEAALADARQDLQLRQMELMQKDPVYRIFGDKPVRSLIELPREELPRTAAMLDGRPTQVLELGAPLGGALGLRPGDVLRVADLPESRPAATDGAGPGD
jgi:hypothetical protein